jgi:hypothetical protein
LAGCPQAKPASVSPGNVDASAKGSWTGNCGTDIVELTSTTMSNNDFLPMRQCYVSHNGLRDASRFRFRPLSLSRGLTAQSALFARASWSLRSCARKRFSAALAHATRGEREVGVPVHHAGDDQVEIGLHRASHCVILTTLGESEAGFAGEQPAKGYPNYLRLTFRPTKKSWSSGNDDQVEGEAK